MEQYLHLYETWNIILYQPYTERVGGRLRTVEMLPEVSLQEMCQLLRKITRLLFRVSDQPTGELATEVSDLGERPVVASYYVWQGMQSSDFFMC